MIGFGLAGEMEEERQRIIDAALDREVWFNGGMSLYNEQTDPAVPGTNKREALVANKIRGQVVGGAVRDFDGVSTVADIAAQLGAGDRTAMVNGLAADHSTVLKDYDYVTFTDKKKGG